MHRRKRSGMNLSDLDFQSPEPELFEFKAPEPRGAAAEQRKTTVATGVLEDGEVGRYARKPDNRDTVAHYTNFGNRATHANKDMIATGVQRGAEVGVVKAEKKKPKPMSFTGQSLGAMLDSGLDNMQPKTVSKLESLFRRFMENERLRSAPPPSKRHMDISNSVLKSMNIPASAKEEIKQQPPKIQLAVVQNLSAFVPVKPPSRRQRTLSREPRSPRESQRRRDIVKSAAEEKGQELDEDDAEDIAMMEKPKSALANVASSLNFAFVHPTDYIWLQNDGYIKSEMMTDREKKLAADPNLKPLYQKKYAHEIDPNNFDMKYEYAISHSPARAWFENNQHKTAANLLADDIAELRRLDTYVELSSEAKLALRRACSAANGGESSATTLADAKVETSATVLESAMEALDEHGEHIQKKADHGQMNLSEKMAAHSEAFTYENEAEAEEGPAAKRRKTGANPQEEVAISNANKGEAPVTAVDEDMDAKQSEAAPTGEGPAPAPVNATTIQPPMNRSSNTLAPPDQQNVAPIDPGRQLGSIPGASLKPADPFSARGAAGARMRMDVSTGKPLDNDTGAPMSNSNAEEIKRGQRTAASSAKSKAPLKRFTEASRVLAGSNLTAEELRKMAPKDRRMLQQVDQQSRLKALTEAHSKVPQEGPPAGLTLT